MTDGYEPRFDLDQEYGEQGEDLVALVRSLFGRIETKRKRYGDFRFYVEIAQRPKDSLEYKGSGINTSEADYWAYVIADTGVIVMVPREVLKAAAARAPDAEERDGDNPTKGRLVSVEHLFPSASKRRVA